MTQYFVSITIQTENKTWSSGGGVIPTLPGWVRDHALDAGTYVEVETTGDVCDVEAPHSDWIEDWNIGSLDVDPLTNDLDPRCVFHVNRTGRNLVLLAVAGDGQVFDHWEGKACADQGARCEVAEPPDDVESLGYGVTAVFKARPEQSHGRELDPGDVHRLTDTLPDPPRR